MERDDFLREFANMGAEKIKRDTLESLRKMDENEFLYTIATTLSRMLGISYAIANDERAKDKHIKDLCELKLFKDQYLDPITYERYGHETSELGMVVFPMSELFDDYEDELDD